MTRLLPFLHDELAPFPGRMNVALRAIAASAIVIVASMTLEVPYLAVSLIVVFYATQANVVVTRLIALLFLAGVTLAVGCTVLVLKLTFDVPLLRIVFASAIFFCCLYAMRIFQFGIVFFVAALVTIYVQTFVDVTEDAESIVRATLWVWAAVGYPIAVTLIINSLLLPAEPRDQMRRLMVAKLAVVQACLEAWLDGSTARAPLTAHDVESTTTALQKLLRFSGMRGKLDALAQSRDLATVTAVSNLYVAASNLRPSVAPSAPLAARGRALRDACAVLARAIENDEPFAVVAPGAPQSDPNAASTQAAEPPWALVAMNRALLDLAACMTAQTVDMHAPPRQPVLAKDAWTNPVYGQFALKTLLAVLVCYLFYNSADWQGVHTVMLTCLVVAQPGLGASSRRSVLRFWGAVGGSLLALFVVVFVLPQIDSIAALLVAVLPVLFAGAWIAAGSERISYAGVQLMFTFSLAFLEQFAPTFDLTEIRDRMVGIFLGIAVATFVQITLWPEGEAALLRRRLSASLASIAKLLAPGDAQRETSAVAHARIAAWAALSDCEGLLLRVALEPTWREGEEERVTLLANSVLAAARELLLAADALRSASDAAGAALPARLDERMRDFASRAASAIAEYARGLAEPAPSASAPRLPGVIEDRAGESERGAELLAEAERVRRAVSSLPDWVGDAAASPLALQAGAHHD
ncbi:FUSC family protein [Paraburkholderia pallida]|uniref:FUSC family protein n=1 Tax=Paraburkholderia pallida TaxID=2547399 RepID=A0A4V1B0A6_9BURK|nr:FUSC family protein [Paraburkholderia pallida]QBR02103.1 FUSC family protein [Paraburkholderia pallida]